MIAKEFLDKAATHMQDRASTYDKPQGERSMTATVGAFNAINGTSLTEEQGWMFMELLKIVRSIQGNYKADNYEDAVAYAALRGECASANRGSEPSGHELDTMSYAMGIESANKKLKEKMNNMVIGTAGERMREKIDPSEIATWNEMLVDSNKVKQVFHEIPKFMCSLCGAMDKSALFIIHKNGCPNA